MMRLEMKEMAGIGRRRRVTRGEITKGQERA